MPDEEFRIIGKVRLVVENINELKKSVESAVEPAKVRKLPTADKVVATQQITQVKQIGNIVSNLVNALKGSTKGLEDFVGSLLDLFLPGGRVGIRGGEARAGVGAAGGRAGGGGAMVGLLVAFLAIGILKEILGFAMKIYNFLKEASPILKSTHDIFLTALKLFFMPFGNILGILLRPLAIFLLKLAILWIKVWRPFEKFLLAFTKDPFGTLMKGFQQIFEWAVEALTGFFTTLFSALGPALASIGKFIVDGLVAVGNAIVNAIMRLPEAIVNAIKGVVGGWTPTGALPPGRLITPTTPSPSLFNITGW